jgi:Protein of unknown function (DUF1571)
MRRWAVVLLLAAAGITIYWWQSQPPPAVEKQHEEPTKVEQPRPVFKGKELSRQELLAALAWMPGQGFPAALPWDPLCKIGEEGLVPLEAILHHQPLLFLEWCQANYREKVKGYTCTFCKQERVKGKLLAAEKIDVHFCQEPFKVHMHFLEGGQAQKVLYPSGNDKHKLLARPKGALIGFVTVSKDINAPDVAASSRFPVSEFGIGKAMDSTVASMHRAKARNALHVRYEGIFKVPELDNRECYKLVRTPYDPPELEGIYEYTIYVDKELMLQTGSVLRNQNRELIAEYWFRNVNLNPEFDKEQFTPNSI